MHSYELYDLVALNNNEAAVVIAVGNEKLIVIDHSDDRKELLPPELQGADVFCHVVFCIFKRLNFSYIFLSFFFPSFSLFFVLPSSPPTPLHFFFIPYLHIVVLYSSLSFLPVITLLIPLLLNFISLHRQA